MYNSQSKNFYLSFGIIFLFFSISALAQINNSGNSTDSSGKPIVVKHVIISTKDSVFVNNDTLLIIKNILVREKDTLLGKDKPFLLNGISILPKRDTIVKITEHILISQDTLLTMNERVLKDIQAFSKRDTYFHKALREILVFRNPAPPLANVPLPTLPTEGSAEQPKEYIVRHIEVKVLDAFGYSLNDSTSKPISLLEKSGNAVHLKSRRFLVKNILRFSEGKKINAFKIYESERLLRQTPFIYNAKITYIPVPNTDSVDVKVVAQDVWSIGIGVGASVGDASLSLNDVNFLGLGQQLGGGIEFNKKLPGGKNYNASYTINNIYNSLSTAYLSYTHKIGVSTSSIGINREFTTSSLRWVGGINSSWVIIPRDIIYHPYANNSSNQDIWAGYSTNFSQHEKSGARLITAGRYQRTNYTLRPELINSFNYGFFNSNLYLGSIGIINRNFFRDSYVYRLGKPEDIPKGYALILTAGIQQRDFDRRSYAGLNAFYSTYSARWGYFFLNAAIGGFNGIQNKVQEGVLNTRFLYFSPLLKINSWRWRNFFSVRYTKGFNQVASRFVDINRENGSRLLNSPLLLGTQKFVINYEADLIPKLDFLGFRMAWVLYADLAWVGNSQKLLTATNFFPGFGTGIRFRNDHLIFSQLQLFIAYYPTASHIQKKQILYDERSKTFYNGYDFNYSRPSQVPFN